MGKTGRAEATIRTATRYTGWCSERGLRAFPASYRSVAGFVAAEVARLKGSTKSVANMVSSIKVFGDNINLRWLTEGEQKRLKKVRALLVLEDKAPVRRVQPVTLEMLQQCASQHWDLRDPYDLLCATMAFTAHNGLLRCGELLCGLKVKDLQWDARDRSVTLHLFPTKTERNGAGVYVRITDYQGQSAYKLLKRWVSTQGLTNKHEHYVFPFHARRREGVPTRFEFRKKASRKWFSSVTRKLVTMLGRDCRDYTNHSYRAGGATDLFVCGVPYPQIKKYGRWRSDSALVYLREEVEVAAAVASAFGGGCRGRVHRRAVAGVGVSV